MAFDHPFYFLRHGETTWNASGKTQGQLNSPLSDRGREQAEVAGEALAAEPIERIVASPLDRAFHTAEAVARRHGLVIQTDTELMECHLGDHQGQPHGPFLPAFFRGEYDPPNGETFQQFCARVWGAMQRAVAQGPNTLIVAHGGLWIATRTFVSVDPDLRRMPNALPLHVTPGPGGWVHRVCGDVEPAPIHNAF
ncbi:MAG: histidine phosphatase family protein [Pseudomonadota bacterium]